MSLGRAFSMAVRGVAGETVEIEADINGGLPGVHLVGLPDAVLQESRDRVRSAITNSGATWPMARLTLALSPATLPKMGSVYDVALAAAVMSAEGGKSWYRLEKTVLLGELALDGRVRPVRGVLPALLAAQRQGWATAVVPVGNLGEASLVDGIEVLGVGTLNELRAWLDGGALAGRIQVVAPAPEPTADLADVLGQAQARFAIEVAAAGAHHVMMTGPPGVGKTMLAQRLPGLLPALTEEESLEVTAIHSVAGVLSDATPLVTRAPFVAPHPTSSVAAMVGGGSGMARPGAISRAHRGVLFLDECAEIGTSVLEALRTPLEAGEVHLARRDGVAHYPARFQLVLAANPCPCAPPDPRDCICPAAVKRRYLGKLSGPLMDRVDLKVELQPVRTTAFAAETGEPTEAVRQRVSAARDAAAARWRRHGIRTNAEVSGPLLRLEYRLHADTMRPLSAAMGRGLISIRGVDRCLRVAWTLADLAGRGQPNADDVAMALSFRQSGAGRWIRQERLAWAYLSRVAEPPCPPLAELVHAVGVVEAADRVRRGAVPPEVLSRVEARQEMDCAADDLEILDRRGGRLITPDDDEWPDFAMLAFTTERPGTTRRAEDHPPLVLWAVGPATAAQVACRAVAVVGTRACTTYGEQVAADLTAGLVERDVAVVSGGAYGIDGAAHRAALACEGVTVAVLAGGVDVPYPAGHSALLHRVATHGLMLSEYPPGVRPARYRFLTRNRLVAGLSGATVVVEAGLRSGAANTAAWARTLGRTVCVVPGPVTSAASAGCHQLLRSNPDAVLVTRADEIVEEMGRMGELAEEPERPATALDALTPVQQRVYEALPGRGARTLEEVAAGAGVAVPQVMGQLALLELEGLVRRDDGRWRLA